jgi:hypothetical protein
MLVAGAIVSSVVFATTGCDESDPAGHGTPAVSQPAGTLPDAAALRDMIDEVVDITASRNMNSRDHAAWQIVHGILAYGRDLQIEVDGKLVSALDYLLKGGQLKGWVLKPGDRGLEAVLEAGSKTGQGHEDQWAGYLAQCSVDWDEPIVAGDKTYKFGDLVTQAQWDIYEGMEASWTLMALAAYFPSNTTWKSKTGEEWSVERVIAMEAKASLDDSPCGGSHRMGGIALALNRHLADGGQLTGGWKEADEKVQACIRTCREFQQPDGTFSVNYWIRPSTSPDASLKLNTTGHQLEFLALAMSDAQLKEPWVTRAVVVLCDLLRQTRDLPLECGGLYHTAHGLQIYRYRRFGPRESAPAESGEAPPKDR